MEMNILLPVLDPVDRTELWLFRMAEHFEDVVDIHQIEPGLNGLKQDMSDGWTPHPIDVVVLPGFTPNWSSTVLGGAAAPDMVSGDDTMEAYYAIKALLMKNTPTFGICGGAQILAWSCAPSSRIVLGHTRAGLGACTNPWVSEESPLREYNAIFDHRCAIKVRHDRLETVAHTEAVVEQGGEESLQPITASFFCSYQQGHYCGAGVQYHPEWIDSPTADYSSLAAYEMIRFLSAKRQGLNLISTEV